MYDDWALNASIMVSIALEDITIGLELGVEAMEPSASAC